MPDKLVKNVAIAKSGIYKYAKEELPSLGLGSTPPAYEGTRFFSVYRPATVLARAVDSFVRLPLTLEHPSEMVDGSNLKKYIVGFTGDSAIVDMTNDKSEVLIKSTLAIIDNSAVRAYYGHTIEVSPGYTADFKWEDGIAPSGEPYQIAMTKITSVNHLAITRYGRGGSAACILDSLGDMPMQRKSGLIYAVRKLLGVKDTGKGFCDQVLELIGDRNKLDDKEITRRVQMLRDSIVDLPVSDGKAKLDRFIEDLDRVKEESDESATEIAKIVNGLYKVLDAEAVEDVAYHTQVETYGKSKEKSITAGSLTHSIPEKGEATDEMEKGAKMPGAGNAKEKEPDNTKSDIEDEKPEGGSTIKGEVSHSSEVGAEKKEDTKKTSEEKGKEYSEQPLVAEEGREEKEHKKASKMHIEGHEDNETIDSKVIDAIADAVIARLEEKNTKKEEPVKDSAIKRVMDSFKTNSSADNSPVKVDDSVKSSGSIARTMKELRGGK